MGQLKKIGCWIIGLLMIGGFLLRLFDGPSDHYNRHYSYGITPEFIYWVILVSTVCSTVVAWYLNVRRWKIALKRKIMLSVSLSMLPTVIFTLSFGWFMWSCGDDPRYREARVLEVLDKSAYEMYVGGKVPTPPVISH